MKSRPVYGTLTPQTAQQHLIVVDPGGAEALRDMSAGCPPNFFDEADIALIGPADAADALKALKPASLTVFPTFAAAEPWMSEKFGKAVMGTHVYVAGTEGVIGQTIASALAHGFERGAISTEHRGSAARRVQCVHCKSFIEDVTTQPVRCTGCGLMLFVRDHYSQRLAAFQGVCIDAEEPGSAPAPEEAFS